MHASRLPIGLLCLSCSVNLESASTDATSHVDVPSLESCRPFGDSVSALEGRLVPFESSDGTPLWLATSAAIGDQISTATLSAFDPAQCLMGANEFGATPALDVSAIGTDLSGRPMGSVTTDTAYLFFSADHTDGLTSAGYGIARWDAHVSRFVALGLLWTADRPSYGSAAVVDGEWLYVFGGLAARFLAADVYLARAPLAAIATPAAYEYWAGGGAWTASADQALPLVEGGSMPSVSYDASHQRWLLAYTTPLSTEISIRSGIGVTGPWSAPYVLGRCALPLNDREAFCGDIVLTRRAPSARELLITQSVSSFDRPVQSPPADYWTRLLLAPWPSKLP